MHYRFPNVGAYLRYLSHSARHQRTLQDHGYGLECHTMCLFTLLSNVFESCNNLETLAVCVKILERNLKGFW